MAAIACWLEFVIVCRHASMVLRPCNTQVSNTDLSMLAVVDHFGERVPPLIFLATAAGRMARQAALFSEGTSGHCTHTNNVELVLTGRNAAREIIEAADYVTEMRAIKHPYEQGIAARKMVDY